MTERRVAFVAGAFVILASACPGSDRQRPPRRPLPHPSRRRLLAPVEGSSVGSHALEATGV